MHVIFKLISTFWIHKLVFPSVHSSSGLESWDERSLAILLHLPTQFLLLIFFHLLQTYFKRTKKYWDQTSCDNVSSGKEVASQTSLQNKKNQLIKKYCDHGISITSDRFRSLQKFRLRRKSVFVVRSTKPVHLSITKPRHDLWYKYVDNAC